MINHRSSYNTHFFFACTVEYLGSQFIENVLCMFYILHSDVGSCSLYRESEKIMKVGSINIDYEDIKKALEEVMKIPLHAVYLQGRDKSLKEALFSNCIDFRYVQSKCLSIHYDLQ